jgi:type IV pilus assembly protein PilC
MLTDVSRVLSLLLGAGVSVVEALYIVSETVSNSNVEGDISRIAKQVEKGFPLSVCFSESNNFPPLIGQMVAVGEETGKMDDVLARLSHYYEVEADLKVKGLTTALEPIILVIMGLGVGILIYAIIMPIYQITNKI